MIVLYNPQGREIGLFTDLNIATQRLDYLHENISEGYYLRIIKIPKLSITPNPSTEH